MKALQVFRLSLCIRETEYFVLLSLLIAIPTPATYYEKLIWSCIQGLAGDAVQRADRGRTAALDGYHFFNVRAATTWAILSVRPWYIRSELPGRQAITKLLHEVSV